MRIQPILGHGVAGAVGREVPGKKQAGEPTGEISIDPSGWKLKNFRGEVEGLKNHGRSS